MDISSARRSISEKGPSGLPAVVVKFERLYAMLDAELPSCEVEVRGQGRQKELSFSRDKVCVDSARTPKLGSRESYVTSRWCSFGR